MGWRAEHDQLPQASKTLCEDSLQFHPPRGTKLRFKETTMKSRKYEHQPHCGSQWPALWRSPAAFIAEKAMACTATTDPADLTIKVFSFTNARPLAPLRFLLSLYWSPGSH